MNNYLIGSSFVKAPICHIHGDEDNVVGYPDNDFTPVDYQEWPLTGFSPVTCGNLTYNHTQVTTLVAGIHKIPFCTNSVSSKEVFLVRLIGKGHQWPNVAGFNAEQFIWDFFSLHQLSNVANCQISGIDEKITDRLLIYPNPTNDELNFDVLENEIEFEIFDSKGNLLITKKIMDKKVNMSISHLEIGIYFLRIRNSTGAHRMTRIVKMI